MQIVPSASGTENYTLAPLSDALYDFLNDVESKRLDKIYGPVKPYDEACKTCLKKGEFQTRLRDGSIVTVECNCREQWVLGRQLLAAGIGDTYQRYSWHNVRGVPDAIIAEVLSYLENLEAFISSGVGLLMWSEETGTGKSLLANLVLKEALAQGHTGYFTSFTEMIDHHTASWSDSDHKAWFANRIQNVGVLVIDEIGKENPGRANIVDELLDRVIRARVAHGRPTFIPTNLNPANTSNIGKDFSRYQAGLLDLLSERNLIIEMTGPGYRRQMASSLVNDVKQGIRYPVVVR